MADSHAKRKLLHFLEEKAFEPVLRADPEKYPASKRDKLADVQRRTEQEIERFRHYGSAEDVVINFRRDLDSEPARKVHRALADLGLPTLNDVRDEFEKLAGGLGVEEKMAFVLKSPAFSHGEEIPSRYTCEGANVSPPLEWSGAPPQTQSFALIMEDPDAPNGVFHHWGLYNIMRERTLLPEGIGHGVKTENMGQGVNDFGHPRYDGPCPPQGDDAHRYHFHLLALDVETALAVPKEPVADLWDRLRPHVIAEATLIGAYARRHS